MLEFITYCFVLLSIGVGIGVLGAFALVEIIKMGIDQSRKETEEKRQKYEVRK